jgi:transglycosylase
MDAAMRALAWIVSLLALLFFRQEWLEVRNDLARIYRAHVSSPGCLPTTLAQQLLISGEDHRFFRHAGIDPIAICRAIWRGIVLRQREGASTIEMQVIRVVSGRFERTLRRKIRELALATLVAREIPKQALPNLYLQIAYFGWRMNGFDGACRRLGLGAEALTPAQTAALAARLKYPQPRVTPPDRWNRINTRAHYLLRLQPQHQHDGTYADFLTEPRYETV